MLGSESIHCRIPQSSQLVQLMLIQKIWLGLSPWPPSQLASSWTCCPPCRANTAVSAPRNRGEAASIFGHQAVDAVDAVEAATSDRKWKNTSSAEAPVNELPPWNVEIFPEIFPIDAIDAIARNTAIFSARHHPSPSPGGFQLMGQRHDQGYLGLGPMSPGRWTNAGRPCRAACFRCCHHLYPSVVQFRAILDVIIYVQ